MSKNQQGELTLVDNNHLLAEPDGKFHAKAAPIHYPIMGVMICSIEM